MQLRPRGILALLTCGFASFGCQATEPTERELFQAVKQHYDATSENSRRMHEECKAGRANAMLCMSVLMTGPMTINVQSVRKEKCEKRRAANEYN